MRVAFHEMPVLEDGRLALFRIDDDVAGNWEVARRAPLSTGRKVGTAAAAQVGRLDGVDDLIGRQRGQRPPEAAIGALREGAVDVGRIRDAAVSEKRAFL